MSELKSKLLQQASEISRIAQETKSPCIIMVDDLSTAPNCGHLLAITGSGFELKKMIANATNVNPIIKQLFSVSSERDPIEKLFDEINKAMEESRKSKNETSNNDSAKPSAQTKNFRKEALDISLSIMERCQSFEDACAINNTNPDQPQFTSGSANTIAYEKLKEIRNALLEGKALDARDVNQKKWFPVHEHTASGFRFDDSFCVFAHSLAPVRLCLDTQAKSDFFGTKFIDLWEQYKN